MTHCPAETTPSETAIAELALRIKGGDSDGQMLPLTQEKMTLGAGQSCTLRLQQPGVRALHCLITQGEQGLTIRRWADGTLLNGELFTESPLEIGDCLTLGPIDLELTPYVEPEPKPELLETPEQSPETSEQTPEQTIDADLDELETLQEVIAEENDTEENDHETCRNPWQVVGVDTEEENNAENNEESAIETPSETYIEADLTEEELTNGDLLPSPSVTWEEVAKVRRIAHRRASRLVNELRETRNQNFALGEQFDCMREEITRLEGLRGSLEGEISDAREEIFHLGEVNRQTEKEAKERAEARLAEVQQQVAQRDDLVADLRNELQRQQQELQSLNDEIELANHSLPIEELPQEPAADSGQAGTEAAEATPEVNDLWDIEINPAAIKPSIDTEENSFSDTESANRVENLWNEQSETPRSVEPTGLGSELWESDAVEAPTQEELPAEVDVLQADVLQTTESAFTDPASETCLDSPEVQTEEAELSPVEEKPAEEKAEEVLTKAEPFVPATTAFDPPETPAQKPEPPVSFIDQFRHLLPEDGEENSPDQLTVEPPVAVDSPLMEAPASFVEGEEVEEEDDSIEDYMAQMMARLRGEETPAPQVTPTVTPTATPVAAPTPEPVAEKAIAAPVKPLSMEDLDELKKGPAPEHSRDMSALRDLANDSTRHSIKVSSSSRARETAHVHLALSAMAIGFGGYAAWVSSGSLNAPLPLFGGLAAATAGVYWAFRTVGAMLLPRRCVGAVGEAKTSNDMSNKDMSNKEF